MSGTQQAAAPPPAAGMRRLPFPLESYEHASSPLSAKRLLNFFPEAEPSDARTAAALLATPGLTSFETLGAGPIQAMNGDVQGQIYVVSGTHAYRIRFPLTGTTVEDLGDVGIPDTGVNPDYAIMVTIAVGTYATVFCVPPRAYTCGHGFGDPLNQIGGDYPGAQTVDYLDGYFIYTAYDLLDRFYISRLLDPTLYDALDFASSDAVPNVVRRVIAFQGNLWMMGEDGIEVWYDSGNADFPFRRLAGGTIKRDVATSRSIATADSSVFWVGWDNIVYRTHGYQAVRISTHALEAQIQTRGGHNIVSAFAYSQEGHTFYVINFADATYVYDAATKAWHDRSSSTDGNARWRVNASCRFSSGYLGGDVLSGKLFHIERGAETEDGSAIMRQATLPPLWGGTKRLFCHRLEVEMEAGTGSGDVLLEWSDDGANSWTGARTLSSGATGQFRKRVFTTRLGSFRQRTYRLTTQHRATIYAVDGDITAGTS